MRYGRQGLAAGVALTLLAACADTPLHGDNTSIIWQAPKLYAAGQISTTVTEVRLAISPDGRHEVWGVIDQRGQGWDLWERVLGTEGWSTPTPVSFNSSSNDFDPAFSVDGQTLFFFSNRSGSVGGDDIWSVRWLGDRWGQASRLDDRINTGGNEWAPTPLASGCLLFASDGHAGQGGMDLFQSCQRHGQWQAAIALNEINSAAHEYDAAVLSDGHSLIFTRSANPDAGGSLWLAQPRDNHYQVSELPTTVNSASGWNLGPSTSAAHPGKLFISSYREEQHVGQLDIFVVGYQLPQ